MKADRNVYKNKLLTILNNLPETQLREIYHFTIFLSNRSSYEDVIDSELPAVPISHLHSLSGLIAVGGDAVKETEELYHA